MHRSGEITPRRAACARSKREVCVGNRSVTWRAISAPVAVMPMNTGPDQARIAAEVFSPERGVGLVADDDRVGVGDLARVAHEPLVGLDRDRPVGGCPGRRAAARDAVAIAAVAELAVELVDEVAPVGEDQYAAGPRGLDEAERGDRLAGAGRVLEPEPAVGVRVLGRFVELDVLVELVPRPASPGLLVLGARRRRVLVGLVRRDPRPRGGRRGRERDAALARAERRRAPLPPFAVALRLGQQRGQRARQRVDLVGRQHRAVGEVGLLLGEQPLEPEQQRELAPPLDRGRACAPRRSRSGRRRAPAGGPSRARVRPRASRRRRRTAHG